MLPMHLYQRTYPIGLQGTVDDDLVLELPEGQGHVRRVRRSAGGRYGC